ncbi:phage terminase [Leucobacter luti]|uniref:Phage terminase n=1 Tax=Leucobacter luti TaxID=340320 RepID=A0A4Q7U034_9MICO|nr:phage terminase [Leucobacter luti]
MRRGSQLPRIESYPLFHSSAADDAVDLAAVAGLGLYPWQEHVLRGSLGERVDGRWSAFRTCLVVPRQNGKNAVLEARELAGLLLFNEGVIIHTAHEFKTANNSMIALMNRIKASPLLAEVKGGAGMSADDDLREIDGFRTGNNPAITMKNGNKLQFAARSGGSGRGFTGDLVVLDEAYALKSAEMDALLPTMAAKSIEGNPQVWFTSSAGMLDSDLLASLRAQAQKESTGRLAYYEWSTADDTDPLDRDGWYEANPSLGYRISEEFVQDEYDTLVGETGSDEGFKRERLGIWAKLGGSGIIPQKPWAESAGDALTVETETREIGRVAFAVDIPRSRDSASIVMAGDLGNGRTSLVLIDRRVGTDWVADRLAELKAQYNPVAIVIDELAATGTILGELRRLRIRVWAVKYREYLRACGALFDAISQMRIVHTGQQELNDAVSGAGRKDGESTLWKWAASSSVDISPLVAATLAFAGLHRRSGKPAEGGQRKLLVMGR